MARNTTAVNANDILDAIKSADDGSVKKLEGRVWGSKEQPLEEGDFLVGQLSAVDENVGDHDSTMLRFEDPHGNEVATWQRGTLKTKVTRAQLGKYLLIEYKGTTPPRKKGQDPMHVYDVYSITRERFNEFAKLAELPF